jgi:hypothetical protein
MVSLAAERGLVLRKAEDRDFAAMHALALHSFPVPNGWATAPENVAHYCPDGLATANGPLRAIVARDGAGELLGHAYYQLRPEGDCYFRELAAMPLEKGVKVPYIGAMLMGYALEEGLEQGGIRDATLNVLAAHRIRSRPWDRWRDPVGYYCRFGFAVRHFESGYTASGKPRPPGDTWMRADLLDAFEKVFACTSKHVPLG